MSRSAVKLLAGFAVVAGLLAVTVVVLALRQPSPSWPPLPNPNGYEELLKAHRMLAGKYWDFPNLDEQALRALVTTNAPALALARTGLTHACQVPSVSSSTNSSFVDDVIPFRTLSQATAAEGKLRESEAKPGDAAGCYLDAIRLGCAASRGGVIIHSMSGMSCEGLGIANLERLAPNLDAQNCRELAKGLEAADGQRASATVVLALEREWARRRFGLKGQLMRLLSYSSIKQTEQRWTAKLHAHEARTRRLMLDLAVRAYGLDNGQRPKDLAALVPKYLQAIPQDPLTGTNMLYRP